MLITFNSSAVDRPPSDRGTGVEAALRNVSQRNHLVSVGCGWLLGGALPCEALERRRLRVDAERHPRRGQLLRYELMDLLCGSDVAELGLRRIALRILTRKHNHIAMELLY